MYMSTYHSMHLEVRGQLVTFGSLLPLCRLWGQNSTGKLLDSLSHLSSPHNKQFKTKQDKQRSKGHFNAAFKRKRMRRATREESVSWERGSNGADEIYQTHGVHFQNT